MNYMTCGVPRCWIYRDKHDTRRAVAPWQYTLRVFVSLLFITYLLDSLLCFCTVHRPFRRLYNLVVLYLQNKSCFSCSNTRYLIIRAGRAPAQCSVSSIEHVSIAYSLIALHPPTCAPFCHVLPYPLDPLPRDLFLHLDNCPSWYSTVP